MSYVLFIALLIAVIAQGNCIGELRRKLSETDKRIDWFALKLDSIVKKIEKLSRELTLKDEKPDNYAENVVNIIQPISENILPEVNLSEAEAENTVKEEIFSNTENIEEQKNSEDVLPEKQIPEDVVPKKRTPEELKTIIMETAYAKEEYKEEKFDVENLFMGNIFNKIGALAVIVGVAIFVKIISPFIQLTPLMQIALAYLVGGGIFASSIALHKKEFKAFSEVLMGTSLGIFFVTTFCACNVQKIMPTHVEVIFCMFLISLSCYISHRYKNLSSMLIGLFGGYLCPLFMNANISFCGLVFWLLFLNLVTLVYVRNNNKIYWLNIFNLVFAMIIFLVFVCISNKDITMWQRVLTFVLWGMHFVYNTICKKSDYLKPVINWITFAIFIGFTFCILQNEIGAIIATFIAFSLYCLSGLFIKVYDENTSANMYSIACMSLIFFTIACFRYANSPMLATCMFSIEALLFIMIERAYNTGYLKKYSLSALCLAFSTYLHTDNFLKLVTLNAKYPIFNERLILLGMPALSAAVSSRFLDKKEILREVFLFIAFSFVYLFALFELGTILKTHLNVTFYPFASIILGFIYSANAGIIGKRTNSVLFNAAANVLFFVSLAALFVILSLKQPTQAKYILFFNLKFAAFLSAICASAFYAKIKKSDAFNALAIILGAVSLYSECTYLFDGSKWIDLCLSFVWLTYSSIVMVVGIFINKRVLKTTGIFLTLISVFKIVFYDLIGIDPIFKMLEFLILGTAMLVVSFLYTGNKK